MEIKVSKGNLLMTKGINIDSELNTDECVFRIISNNKCLTSLNESLYFLNECLKIYPDSFNSTKVYLKIPFRNFNLILYDFTLKGENKKFNLYLNNIFQLELQNIFKRL